MKCPKDCLRLVNHYIMASLKASPKNLSSSSSSSTSSSSSPSAAAGPSATACTSSTASSSSSATAGASELKSGAFGLKNRFGQMDWLAAEQRVSPFNQMVYQTLINHALEKESSDYEKQTVLGDYFYKIIREKLLVFDHCQLVQPLDRKGAADAKDAKDTKDTKDTKDEKKKSKDARSGKGGKGGKGRKDKNPKKIDRDTIRLEASKEKVNKAVEELLVLFKKTKLNKEFGLKSKYIELIGITLMYCAWFMLHAQPEYYNKPSKRRDIYGLIVGIKKFISKCSNYTGKSVINESTTESVSPLLLNDLGKWSEKLESKYPFDGFLLNDIAPELMYHTEYDSSIPQCGIAPRQNQIDIVKTVKEHFNNGFLVSYKAMPSSGKTTTAIVCISTIIHELSLKERSKGHLKKYELLFVCNLPSVKSQAAQIAYNSSIKFAMAHIDRGRVKISNHNTTVEAERDLIICSPDVAAELLKQEEIRLETEGGVPKYIVFVDEPTVDADRRGSEALLDNMQVLKFLPYRMILSSATMCELSKIPTIVGHYKTKYPGAHVGTIYSNEIQIGCDVKTFDGERIMPHLGCKTRESLQTTIRSIAENPFLGRLYTNQVAKLLWEKLVEKKIKGLPDITVIFSQVENLSLDKVRQVCMKMLLLLSETTNELVEEICKTTIDDGGDMAEEKDDEDDIFFEEKVEVPSRIDPLMLGTYQAYLFPNMNLIVDTDPVSFAETNFRSFLELLAKNGCDSAAKLYADYEREKASFDKTYSRLETRVKSDLKRSKEQQDMREEKSPTIKFPSSFQINTEGHIKQFAGKHRGAINPKDIRVSYPLELIPYKNCVVPDWVMILLFAGIGIYCPSSKILNEAYNSTVLDMASSDSLAYLISDRSISYGTNYALYSAIVTERFTNEHKSSNLWFQLFSRTGRPGQSWKSAVIISNSAAMTLLNYAKHPETSSANIEADNIEDAYLRILAKVPLVLGDGGDGKDTVPAAGGAAAGAVAGAAGAAAGAATAVDFPVHHKFKEDYENEEEIISISDVPRKEETKKNIRSEKQDWRDRDASSSSQSPPSSPQVSLARPAFHTAPIPKMLPRSHLHPVGAARAHTPAGGAGGSRAPVGSAPIAKKYLPPHKR